MFVNNLHVSKRCVAFIQHFTGCRKLSASSKNEISAKPLSDQQEHQKFSENISKPLYNDHIPTSLVQKTLLTLGSSVLCITDPFRHDMIAVLGETTGYTSAKQIREKMLNDPEGNAILNDKNIMLMECLIENCFPTSIALIDFKPIIQDTYQMKESFCVKCIMTQCNLPTSRLRHFYIHVMEIKRNKKESSVCLPSTAITF